MRNCTICVAKTKELISFAVTANQLRSYCEADLRLCFRICRLLVFPCGGSYIQCSLCGVKISLIVKQFTDKAVRFPWIIDHKRTCEPRCEKTGLRDF